MTITRIATIQRSLRELGRIRLGDQVAYQKDGRTHHRPRKLATFRLTSASREYLEVAAEAYGGAVREWESPRGREYELTIEAPALDVLVPPGDAVTQAYELWTGGGCQRRCDGELQEATDEKGNRLPCACPADVDERVELAAKGQACKPTTRLWVILPRLPDLGRWRLEAHGYYAAVELAGMAEIASMATSRGIMLPARLRIDQRQRKIPGRPTRDYIVPVLELPDTNFGQLVAAGFIPTTNTALEAGDAPPALPDGRVLPARQLTDGKPRRQRAERPSLGEPPGLPESSDFGRPRAAAPAEPIEPPAMGGWQVEPEPATAAATPAPAPEPSEEAPFVPAAPGCRWRLGQGAGKPAIACTFPELHRGEHSWQEVAMTKGGRVIRPEDPAA